MTVLRPSAPEPETPREEVDLRCSLAAQAAPLWEKFTPEARADALTVLADALDANTDHLVHVAADETGYGKDRLTGEVRRTTGQLRMFAERVRTGAYLDVTIDRADPDHPLGPRPELRRYQVPVGPVLVFAAGNFPFAFSVAGTDTASALAAGCPVVLKAHPGHPRTSAATAGIVSEVLARVGAPDGVFSMITGRQAGVRALRDPHITAAAFTGSVRGGRALFDIAASRPTPIPFHGELGSVNPVVVTPGVPAGQREEIAAGFVASYTLGNGQFCTKPGVLLVPQDMDMVELVTRAVRQVAAAPMLSPETVDGYERRLAEIHAAAGTDVLVKGEVTVDDAGTALVSPSLIGVSSIAELREAADVLLEECFGPTALVVQYDSVHEVEEILAALEGALTVSIHTPKAAPEPQDEYGRLLELAQQRAGRVVFNAWPTGVAVTHAQHHGGPYPAATSAHTSVGTAAAQRFLRPVVFQNAPEAFLPPALQESNPLHVPRTVDGETEPADTPPN
ncbi:aldehyde dehydrogenase (NADP(+)) [Streptomyces cavernicola]|uniref:Aldehyde dehydrogenase (NADP(+)) n=1 Tax=Streptomyces cavernicola TaxID=3043613 RepID=A0ABT6SG67_9ACTN|nr:aldehyde dehydrogenase (NADP(+)) [Streptomyces sp. B-S-A6]MDI3406418.1 aldehyde dehydrogenase (NADP(+)) [Streptomyces sp. B-S-A6]